MYTCVCEFTRMITNFSLARTERSLSLLLRCFALLCVVLTLALAIAPVFVRLVAQLLPLLSLSMLLVWLVAVVALGLGFLALFIAPILLFTSCPAFLLSSGFYNAVADWGFSDAVASTLVLLLLLLNFLLLPTLTAWHCCSCLCCVSFVAFNASWYCWCSIASEVRFTFSSYVLQFCNDLCTSFSLLGSKARQTCADQIGHILGIRLGKNMKQAPKETWKTHCKIAKKGATKIDSKKM